MSRARSDIRQPTLRTQPLPLGRAGLLIAGAVGNTPALAAEGGSLPVGRGLRCRILSCLCGWCGVLGCRFPAISWLCCRTLLQEQEAACMNDQVGLVNAYCRELITTADWFLAVVSA